MHYSEIPSDWSTGIIMTLYKGKGPQLDPNNYTGITLLSCVGKLFTSIMNYRLNEFLNIYHKSNENHVLNNASHIYFEVSYWFV